MLVDSLYALEELRVERYVVAQLGEFRLDAHRDSLHLVRGVGFEQVEEYAGDASEQFALILHCLNGVGERRFGRIVHYRVHFGAAYGDCRFECRLVVRDFYLVERRGLMRGVPLGEERIRRVDFGQLHYRHRVVGAACRKCGD